MSWMRYDAIWYHRLKINESLSESLASKRHVVESEPVGEYFMNNLGMNINSMNSKNKGFSLVEVVMILVVAGLIGSLAIPRYVGQSSEALMDAKKDTSRVVKSAMVVALADTRDYPSVSKLASYVQADKVDVRSNGIEVTRDGTRFTVPTYVDVNCSKMTRAVNDIVQCVGSIP
jgi:type II secretory pathway pseudopilin PulG